MPYRSLVVIQDEPVPAKVSCSDCVWGRTDVHGGMAHRACYLFSRDPSRPGDPRFVGNIEARLRFNFNDDGDCFGHQRPWLTRALRWLNALIRA